MTRLVLILAALAVAADWPHVRGPVYDAHSIEVGLAERWPESGPPVLWTRELGPGYSAFVIAEGRAFTLYQTSAGMFLIALNADTGKEIWTERVDWPWQPGGMYPGPYASPTWSGGRIFYATPTGNVGCVDAASGHTHWTVNVRERFGSSRGTQFGYASTPTVEDGRVYLPVGGANSAMVALSVEDGRTFWAAGDEPASYCPAYPITLDGRRCIVGFLENSLMLFDAKSGERLWRQRLSSSYDEHAAWPLFDGQHLLVASPFRVGSQTWRLSTTANTVTAKPLWSGRQFSNDVCSSLLHDGAVYGFDIQQAQASTHRTSRGTFKCLDFATGKVRWTTDQVGQASVIHADGKLILWSETGTLILARASAERFEELARMPVLSGGGMCWAAPALAGKRLIVRDQKQAVCLWLGSPNELDPAWQTQTLTAVSRGFDWTRLVPKEPDFPNDEPNTHEIAIWFVWSIGILFCAAVAGMLLRIWFSARSCIVMFAVLAFGLGAAGTTAIGAWFDTFALTWPVSLYIAYRRLFGFASDAHGWRKHLLPRLALGLFIALCFAYYRLCMAVGYAMAWGFLSGFVPALPFVLLARRVRNPAMKWFLEGTAFSIYFWTSALIPGWKSKLVE